MKNRLILISEDQFQIIITLLLNIQKKGYLDDKKRSHAWAIQITLENHNSEC